MLPRNITRVTTLSILYVTPAAPACRILDCVRPRTRISIWATWVESAVGTPAALKYLNVSPLGPESGPTIGWGGFGPTACAREYWLSLVDGHRLFVRFGRPRAVEPFVMAPSTLNWLATIRCGCSARIHAGGVPFGSGQVPAATPVTSPRTQLSSLRVVGSPSKNTRIESPRENVCRDP